MKMVNELLDYCMFYLWHIFACSVHTLSVSSLVFKPFGLHYGGDCDFDPADRVLGTKRGSDDSYLSQQLLFSWH